MRFGRHNRAKWYPNQLEMHLQRHVSAPKLAVPAGKLGLRV